MEYPYCVLEYEGPGFPVDDRDTITDMPPVGCRETIIPMAPTAPITLIPTGDDD